VCVASWPTVTRRISPPWFSSGTYLLTGSAKVTSPRSNAWATTVASKTLRTDARLNSESDVIDRSVGPTIVVEECLSIGTNG
jgi:hypothetical protein